MVTDKLKCYNKGVNLKILAISILWRRLIWIIQNYI